MRLASLAVVAALVVAACGREPMSTLTPGRATLQFGPLFQTSGTGTVSDSVTAGRFTVTRTSPPPVEVIANVVQDFSRIQGNGTPDSLSVSFPLQGDNAEYAVLLKAVNFQGDTVFQIGPLQFKGSQIDDKGVAHVTTNESDVRYIGPGSEATRVVASAHVVNLTSGQVVQLSATAYGPGGAALPRARFQWFQISNQGVASTSSGGRILAGGKRGSEKIGVRIASVLGPADTVVVNVALPASQIQLVSGGGQFAAAGATLASPIVVRVVAADGLPVSGVGVQFSAGGGSVSPTSATTASDGTAQTRWTLGSSAGQQTLNATVPGLPGSLQVQATATQAALSLVSGNGQTGTAGAQLADPIVVRVLNGTTPVAGTTVTFAVASGGGSVTPGSITTDASGYAQARWTLGASGTQLLSVSAANSSPALLAVSATLSPPVLSLVSGNGQSGSAGAQLANPIVVQVLNGGTPVPGTTVTFTVTSGGGSVTPGSITTDASGRAQTRWTLGTSGTQSLSVSAANSSPASLAVSATLSPPVLSLVSGGGQSGNSGAQLASPIVVQVLSGTSPVVGTNVVFTVTGGGGSVSSSSSNTDANGRAQTSWTLGSTAGTQTMSVTAANVSGSISVTATATAATQVSFISILPSAITTSQSATITVQVATTATNPVAVSGVVVSFSSSGSGNTFTPVSATTGANGQATTVFTSTVAATKTLTASIGTATAQTTLLVVAPTAATQLVKVSGDNQTVRYGTNFGQAMVVRALDAAGQPVLGALIDWGTTTGNVRRATDADGLSSFQYSLPNDPVNYPTGVSLTVRVPLVGTTATVTFTYFAVP